MAGRPAGGGGSSSRTYNDNLLDLDEGHSTYTSGRPPPATDKDLQRSFKIADDDEAGGRPSISYDDFVGARVERQPSNAKQEQRPSYLTKDDRQYSQTSDLGNYQGDFGDFDDFPDDTHSMHDYYGAGGIDEHTPQVTTGGVGDRFLSVGGGLLGRARRALGIRQQYSEMDLPLTEAGAQAARGPDARGAQGAPESKSLGSRFKFTFGQGQTDYSAAGPRMIHLNNSPANAQNKYYGNSVSTAKYNAFTFVPKFMF